VEARERTEQADGMLIDYDVPTPMNGGDVSAPTSSGPSPRASTR
jgi:hypothetical protein